MTRTTTTTRRLLVLAAAGLATLAIAPAAQAETTVPPDRADGMGGVNATVHTPEVLAPDRADRLGSDRDHPYSATVVPPDRADGLGSERLPSAYVTPPATAPTVIIRSTGAGFDWTAAVIGAVAGIGFAVIALAGTLLFRSRRDIALPS